MCEHEQKHCPKCNASFECKVGSILLCQCTAVTLSQDERDFIAAQYADCLCAACLKDMKSSYHQQLHHDKLHTISPLLFPKK
ncbi:cysteine-rich CWC family protein [Chitinophaga rhizosphaerae]|uniref:cysteine-rich CWC family protein n=1 Tax=Chitinophaga rhizosphaerae TaxID=1864947 RepID=UPI000F8120A0|nr:cysteine-rich CWC family protein [Chitinophaga rhizosphaerae]